MDFGTTFDMQWLGDIGLVSEAAVAYDEAGIGFVSHGGHVLTAAAGRYPDRPLPTYGIAFRDPFVLYTHLAAKTSRLRFRPGILILPMYPTVLVAKQSADLAIVSGGRFELGVGISWQGAEYAAMGQSLRGRGARLEEQLVVLRRLWSEELVTFHGRDHDIDELGLGQLPPPIPIWLGTGGAPALLERVARLADGWMPVAGVDFAAAVSELRRLAPERANSIGVAARLSAPEEGAEGLVPEAQRLQAAGVTAISITPPPGSPKTAIPAVIAAYEVLRKALA